MYTMSCSSSSYCFNLIPLTAGRRVAYDEEPILIAIVSDKWPLTVGLPSTRTGIIKPGYPGTRVWRPSNPQTRGFKKASGFAFPGYRPHPFSSLSMIVLVWCLVRSAFFLVYIFFGALFIVVVNKTITLNIVMDAAMYGAFYCNFITVW